MLNRDPLDRATACCLSIACRYRTGEGSPRARAQMGAEVETLLAHLLELDLEPSATELRVLGPVEDYLLACFGREAGRRLNDDLADAFEAASRTLRAAGGPPAPIDRRAHAGRGGGRR